MHRRVHSGTCAPTRDRGALPPRTAASLTTFPLFRPEMAINISATDGAAQRLRISEIFHSIQGEADAVGWPTVFVRLTGCPLRCTWCDTAYAFEGGGWQTFDEILAEVARYGARHVCVTGGEPLAQKRCLELLARLCDAGHEVSLE